MKLQKTTGFILATLLIAGGISAYSGTSLTAEAANTQTQLDGTNAELFLPTSYEQYLPLSHPSDVAVSDRYIAIAESTSLYLYDRESADGYRLYEHTDAISKIQLTTDGKLYFADGNLGFYELALDGDELCPTTEVGLTALSTFYIEGDTLFSVNMTNTGTEYRISDLSAPNRTEKFDGTEFHNTPRTTYLNGRFYSFVNSLISIYEYNDTAGKYMRVDTQTLYPSETLMGLESVCTLDGKIYFTLNKDASAGGRLKNGLHVYNPEDKTSSLVMEADSLSALTVNGDELYCIQGGSLRKLTLSNGTAAFTEYEIAASSTSVNRFYHAVDMVRARDLLVTADVFSENEGRISVYHFSTGAYSEIPCVDEHGAPFSPRLVATDGEIIAVAAGRDIYVGKSDGESFTLVHTLKSNVRGVACVYGSVYFVTDNYVYGKVGSNDEAVRPYEGDVTAFTNDLYGNLYVAYGNAVQTTVYRFTEQEVINNDASGATVATFPETFSCLRTDFGNNLYYLANDALYKNGQPFSTLDGNEFVYRGKDAQSMSPSLFALGFEDDEVYFTFDNFAIKNKAGVLDIPSLNKIALENAVAQALSPHEPENLFVEISMNTVGILIDLDELATQTDYFPYSRYYRTGAVKSGVLLAETQTYYLVMLIDRNRNYTANLFLKDSSASYQPDVYEETSATRYLSCNTATYYVPCMHNALAGTPLSRGERVTVHGVVSAIDGDYAYVEININARETVRGYVPFTFLTEVNPLGEEPQKYILGTLNDKGAEITFTNGDENITLESGTQVKLFQNEDGTYRAEYEKDGKIYSATVTENMFARGETDALRISLIVILSVLAVVIIGVYVYMLPRKKTQTK